MDRQGSSGLKRLHPVMLAGTGSDVGKSVLATALCRIFLQDGYHPAPFKAQNMALNSYATPEGLEIGRAQAVQAEAAGVPCHTDMNPLLLKPQSDHTSQVVLNGRPIGNRDAYDYFRKEGRQELRIAVNAAFDRLAARYNPIVMEGAGSLAEINLRDSDLVNVPMAMHAGADIILVGDIDRGGVFASVYGSLMLLDPKERAFVKGIIINKFRGDLRLFDEGRRMLEELCGIPVLGVVPYLKDVHIEEEDSVALSAKSAAAREGRINVAVVLLHHISNFTDFNALERDPRVHLFYSGQSEEIAKADIVILPGSKSTLDDLHELRRSGLAQAILEARRRGATILGICGGYQMLGRLIRDPHHVEGPLDSLPGLGLLPLVTEISREKVTRQVHFRLASDASQEGSAFPLEGYEIHMGVTTPDETAATVPAHLCDLEDGTSDGYMADGKCMGTYLHGILDNQAFIDLLLEPHLGKAGKAGAGEFDYHAYKESQYDLLADRVRSHIDMDLLYSILKEER